MISILKYLYGPRPDDLSGALMRMAHLLLEAIRLHAVEGDRVDYEKLQADMQNLERSLGEQPSAAEVLVITGAAIQAMEDYNIRTTRFVRAHGLELQQMVAMLTDTIAKISAGSERSVSNLQNIEKQLERASILEDVRLLKGRLSECLQSLREESARQKEESARGANELRQELERALERRAAIGARHPKDEVTGLPGRHEAEQCLAAALKGDGHTFAAVFVLDRIQLINQRFGYAVGNRILMFFTRYLARGLSPNDRQFRWSGPAILVVLERHGSLDTVRMELARIISARLEKTVQVGNRSVMLHVTATWTVFSVAETASLEGMARKIDAFVSTQAPLQEQ